MVSPYAEGDGPPRLHCFRCKKVKPREEFGNKKRRWSGKDYYCKPCAAEFRREYYSRQPWRWERDCLKANKHTHTPKGQAWLQAYYPSDAAKAVKLRRQLKLRHFLTVEQYQTLIDQAQNKCAGCGYEFPDQTTRHIDHCHASGRVRGLLCPDCNRALGLVKDSPEVLLALTGYLQRFQDSTTAYAPSPEEAAANRSRLEADKRFAKHRLTARAASRRRRSEAKKVEAEQLRQARWTAAKAKEAEWKRNAAAADGRRGKRKSTVPLPRQQH